MGLVVLEFIVLEFIVLEFIVLEFIVLELASQGDYSWKCLTRTFLAQSSNGELLVYLVEIGTIFERCALQLKRTAFAIITTS